MNGKFKIMSKHLAVACLKTHFQHIPEQTENSRIVIISRFSHTAILQMEKLASMLPAKSRAMYCPHYALRGAYQISDFGV